MDETFQVNSNNMSKEKEGAKKLDKKAPEKTLKEKRAAKAEKRKDKNKGE